MSSSKSKKKSTPPSPLPIARRSRRPWVIGGTLALVVVAAFAIWRQRGSAFTLEPDPDQNVLLVTIDTLRADALGAYGGRAATPNLDLLASRGARFTFAHAHAVVTLPSHTSILSGLLPYEHGMRDNSGFRVKPGTPTLGTQLKAAGFATGAFVGGFPLTKRFGLTPGFDVYDDRMPEMHGAIAMSLPERRADVVVSSAVSWIGRQTGKFFSWVHVFDPHSPYKPPGGGGPSGQPYDGEVAWVDAALKPLFDQLSTLARPTLVVVTSDHGESLGEHGELTHGMFAYEPTLRVPLIVARVDPRGRRRHGVVIDTPVRHIDIAPTVLEAVGASPASGLLGSSLLGVIRARSGPDRPSYFESMTYNLVRGWAPLRGVLVERTKYIDLPIAELFDLAADPNEERNLAADQGDRQQVMANTLRTFNVAPPNRPGQESAAAVEALRSLGYVTGSAPAKATYTEADDPKRLVEVDRDLHRANELFEAGRLEDGIAMLERVLARRPDTADAYLSLAHAHWEAGQPGPAIEALERALKHGAPGHDIPIRLGLYLAESHTDSTRAIKLLEGMPADDVEAQNGLGVAYGDAGRYGEAIQAFTRVLALDPTNAIAYMNLASMTLRQAQGVGGAGERVAKLREAEAFARQALEADGTLAGAHTILGVILSGAGKANEAIDAWKRAVQLDAAEFNALYNLWLELAKAGRREEAIAFGRQFVATAPPAFFGKEIAQIRGWLGGT